jgi:acyl carrier protein
MVAEKVVSVIAKVKGVAPEQIALDSTFQELKIDSMTGVAIIYELEDAFDVTISNEDAVQIRTVRQVVERLEQHLAAQSGDPPPAAPG